MSDHVLSILVKAIGAAKASKDLKGVDSTITNIGRHARSGLSSAVGNIARLGAVAGVGLGGAIKTGIDDLATLESATASVDGAIRQLGLTGQVTSNQVAGWANDIEANVGAAFDDKAIVSATSTLIRFGSVTPKNLRKAMTVMTDLAAKTGDVDSAATLLAKALADPEKAAGKLARQGIVLTKSQQDNIKALVKAGKTEQAQAILLDLIATKTKGAAAATQGPYKRALSVLADVSEDARKALAEGFLPIIERVAGFLSKKLADPKVIEDIRGIGRQLADGFDKALSAAEKIPWGTIGDSMRLAGQGAKAALDLFTGLPPWVQTAVITGWGLNKLTGGAVSGIIGELGKGLIKGVLGMNAGVVNINAGVVNGGGGVPGVGGAGAAGAGGLAGLLKGLVKTGAGLGIGFVGSNILSGGVEMGGPAGAGVAAGGAAAMIGGGALAFGPLGAAAGSLLAVAQTFKEVTDASSRQGAGVRDNANVWLQQSPSLQQLQSGLAAVDTGINDIQANPLNVLVAGDALDSLHATRDAIRSQITHLTDNTVRTVAATERAEANMTSAQLATTAAERDVRTSVENNRIAVAAAAARANTNTTTIRDRIEGNRIATVAAAAKTAAAASAAGLVAKAGGLAAAAAVKAKDLSVKVVVPVTTNVSVRSVIGAHTIYGQYSKTSSTQRTQF